MGKSVKMSFVGKTCRKWANGLKIDDSEKNLDPRGLSAPTPGQYYTIIDFNEVDIRIYLPEKVIFTEAGGRGEYHF